MPLGAQLQIGDSRLKDLSLLQPSEELEEVDDIIEHQLQHQLPSTTSSTTPAATQRQNRSFGLGWA